MQFLITRGVVCLVLFLKELSKFSLSEKQELGELVEKYKKEYDKEVASLRGQTTYDYRTKKHV